MPLLVTVDPTCQQIQEGDCLYSKPDHVEQSVRTLATKSENGVIYVWAAIEKYYVNFDVTMSPFSILPNGEIIPKP